VFIPLISWLCLIDDSQGSLPQTSSSYKSKRKHSCVSVDIKLQALDEVDKNIKSKADISKEYGVPASTLSTWIKNSQSLRQTEGITNM